MQTDVVVSALPGPAAFTGDAAAEPDSGLRVPGRPDPEPDAMRVSDPRDEGRCVGAACRPRSRPCRVLHRRRAGDVRGSCRNIARGEGGGYGRRLGLSVLLPGICGGDDVAAVRGGAEPVGRLRGRWRADRCRRRACRSARCGRQFLYRSARGSGGDTLYGPVYGRRGSGWAGRPAGRDRAGVRGHGTGFIRALCGPGFDARPRAIDAAARAVDGDPEGRRWLSRCTAALRGWSG